MLSNVRYGAFSLRVGFDWKSRTSLTGAMQLSLVSASMLVSSLPGLSQSQPARLKLEPYIFESARKEKIEAELGRFLVPENRRKPRSKLIEIAFVRFKSTAKKPGPPIIYLEGGPGGSGIDAARNQAFSLLMAMREFGDVIALDQRASGMSKPNLVCSQKWDRPPDLPGESENALGIMKEKVRACVEELKSKGIDPAGYNPDESADDIEDLRRALGYPKVSLWGISYGTLLALTALKRHEERIDRLILTGVLGPDRARGYLPSTIQDQLDQVDRLFKANPDVNRLIPDFQGLVRSLLDELEKSPVVVEIDDPQTKQKVKVAVNKFDLQLFTAYSLTFSYGIMNLPNFYYPLSKGDWTPLARRALSRRKDQVGPMLGLLMICASGIPGERRKRIEAEAKQPFLLGNAVNSGGAEVCEALGNDLGERVRAPVKSRVPVLLISGTLDGTTPVSNATEVQKGLPNSQHLIVEGAGHGWELFYLPHEVREVMLGFLQGQPVSTDRARSTINLIPVRQ